MGGTQPSSKYHLYKRNYKKQIITSQRINLKNDSGFNGTSLLLNWYIKQTKLELNIVQIVLSKV